MVRSLDGAAIETKMATLLAKPTRDMRRVLTDWARRKGVKLAAEAAALARLTGAGAAVTRPQLEGIARDGSEYGR